MSANTRTVPPFLCCQWTSYRGARKCPLPPVPTFAVLVGHALIVQESDKTWKNVENPINLTRCMPQKL
jgi:hypothetical protein